MRNAAKILLIDIAFQIIQSAKRLLNFNTDFVTLTAIDIQIYMLRYLKY